MTRAPTSALRRLLLAAGLAALAPWAAAQDYPSKPVRIIVPFAAGGPADVYARFLATKLQESMGQPFVVDNRPGAGSIIGTDAVAKSPADGYTLLLMSNTHTVNESLIPTKPFQLLRDFAPIAPINASDLVLVTRGSLPANNLGELIKLARRSRAASRTRRRARARRTTWPASCSRRWRGWRSSTSPTAAARARAPTCSAARST
jgi:tripartite-type tricarboxylate transporter receptor subunit TctC